MSAPTAVIALFEIAEVLAEDTGRNAQPDSVAVHADPLRGHIAVEIEQRGPRQEPIVFVDLGPVLNVWSPQGGNLTPSTARELGAALIAWADRKDGAA